MLSRLRQQVIFAALFITGACGLIYEVVWQRYLANFLGSEAKASALILAVFLGGIACGYVLFGRISGARKSTWLIRLTGFLEIGIGVWAIIFPYLYSLLWRHTPWSGSGLLLDLVIAVALIFIPTLLMGGTLPLLTQAFTRQLDEAGRTHSWIYFFNTAGAFVGCLLAGFLLLPALSLKETTIVAAGMNWLAGMILLLSGLGIAESADQPIKADELPQCQFALRHWRHFLVAFIAGTVSITLQIALTRTVGLAVGSSEYAFALVVALFIGLLALGASSVAKARGAAGTSLWLNQMQAALGLALLYISIPYWPYAAHVMRALLTPVAANFYLYHTFLFLALALIAGLSVQRMGRTMPLLFGRLAERLDGLGATVGSLYFLNTIGCVCGGLVGGYLAYFVFDLDQVFKLCLILLFVSAALLVLGRDFSWRALAGSLALLSLSLFLPRWSPLGLDYGTFRVREATENTFRGAERFYHAQVGQLRRLYHRDGPTASMSVLAFPDAAGNWYPSILINGKSDGSTLADMPTMRLMAHVPALLSTADLSQVAVIGFGTGVTVGSLELYPEVQKVHVFELSATVQEYAPLFDAFNHAAAKSTKVEWHIGDAYREFLQDSTQYGLIASEPSNPWMTGVERLYSREFLTMAATHLKPGGVYAQWFHEYDMSLETVGLVINTFAKVFSEVRIFRTTRGDLLILGANDARWNDRFATCSQRLTNADIATELADLEITGAEDLWAREIPVPKQFFADSGEHTLEFAKLSYQAGYEFFLGSSVDLQALAESSRFKSWEHRFATPSLSLLWLQSHPGAPAAKRMLEAACGSITEIGPFARLSHPCQELFIQWSISEDGKKFDVPQARVLALVGDTAGGGKPTRSPSEAERDLKFLAALDSPTLHVQKRHILEIAESCFAGSLPYEVSCRIQAVRNLAAIGEVQAAYALYSSLKPWLNTAASGKKRELIDLLLEASRANAAGL